MATIEALKAKRKEQKLTFDELAERSGIPKRTLENIFHGITKNPRIDTMQAIEEALELNQPTKFTDEDKALGVGEHGTKLEEEEWEWIELLSELKRTKGDKAVQAVITIIKTFLDEK